METNSLMIGDINLDKRLSIMIALFFATDSLHIIENMYPNETRLHDGIESVRHKVNNFRNQDDDLISKACEGVHTVMIDLFLNKVNIPQGDRSDAEMNSDKAAYNYAESIELLCVSAHRAYGHSLTTFATASIKSVSKAYELHNGLSADSYIHDNLVKLLPMILDYKIENQQLIGNSGKIFEHLDENDKIKFLFNLNILR